MMTLTQTPKNKEILSDEKFCLLMTLKLIPKNKEIPFYEKFCLMRNSVR